MPRNDRDLVVTECGGVPDKCEASECAFELGSVESGDVVISEIQDDPRGGDGPREFVELFNATAESINLSGWRLQNRADLTVSLRGTIPPVAILSSQVAYLIPRMAVCLQIWTSVICSSAMGRVPSCSWTVTAL